MKEISIGDKFACLWQQQYHEVEIVEKRGEKKEYYVHFIDLDRRLDRWINYDELIDPSVVQTPPVIASGSTSSSSSSSLPSALSVSGMPTEQSQSVSISSSSPAPTGSEKRPRRVTRQDKRKFLGVSGSGTNGGEGGKDALEREHEERTKIKNIESIQIGKYQIDSWYFSPYPDEYRDVRKLYICEFCLKYMGKPQSLEKHKLLCPLRHPPGNEIYRDKGHSVFEVDGAKQKVYSQCLCLLAKLFIDHKTLYYDVEPFLFYILTEVDKEGHHVVGYFSKEKESPEEYNLACILTFPQYQRRGYGKFLIAFSYELSKIEGKPGSPEKPLSDLGKVSYRSYWTRVIVDILKNPEHKALSIDEISHLTCIKPEDIISTLQFVGLLKYVKGQHIINATPKALATLDRQLTAGGGGGGGGTHLELDPSKLRWQPQDWARGMKHPKRRRPQS